MHNVGKFNIVIILFVGNYTPRPQQLGNMQYGANQGYGPGPGGQQNSQTNNMGPGQYPGRPMPNHVPQFGYQVSEQGANSYCFLDVEHKVLYVVKLPPTKDI